jgi:hypothetical protein
MMVKQCSMKATWRALSKFSRNLGIEIEEKEKGICFNGNVSDRLKFVLSV